LPAGFIIHNADPNPSSCGGYLEEVPKTKIESKTILVNVTICKEKSTAAVGRVQKATGKEIQPRWCSSVSRKELVDEAAVQLRTGRPTPTYNHSCADSHKSKLVKFGQIHISNTD